MRLEFLKTITKNVFGQVKKRSYNNETPAILNPSLKVGGPGPALINSPTSAIVAFPKDLLQNPYTLISI